MNHLFNAFTLRWGDHDIRQSRSCGDIPDLYTLKKRSLKRALFGSRRSTSPSSMSNSELISSVDAQLMQIRDKLAAFREQDALIRERMNSLTSSVSELTSRSSLSSPTPSECSDSSSLEDNAMQDEGEEFEQVQKAFSDEPQAFCIPTVIVTECKDDFNQTLVRQVTLHSSKMDYLRLPEERRHSAPLVSHQYMPTTMIQQP